MLGYILAVLTCAGANCELTNIEPSQSFPTFEVCQTEIRAKDSVIKGALERAQQNNQTARAICVREVATITEVEEPYIVTDTAIVHSEPSANAPYVGIVESGQRTLVTGIVSGTEWVRIVLADGKTGYVFADHLRKIARAPAPSPPTPSPPAVAVNPPVSGPGPSGTAPPVTGEAPAQSSGGGAVARPKVAEIPPPPAISAERPRPSGTEVAAGSGESPNTFRDCANCPVMVSLAAGEFEMGSNADPTERPIHRVRVGAIAVGKFELSVAEWEACVAAGGCSYKRGGVKGNPDRRPMDNLSWVDAQEYLRWLGKTTGKPYRLLTEAEWEYAARAGTTTRYSWGEELKPGFADCEGCGPRHDRSRPDDMGSFPANRWGLYDMEGNVAEWVQDCWHGSYKGAPTDGSAWQENSCGNRVLRGGSWNNPPSDITVSTRNYYDSVVRYQGNGMRVALTLK